MLVGNEGVTVDSVGLVLVPGWEGAYSRAGVTTDRVPVAQEVAVVVVEAVAAAFDQRVGVDRTGDVEAREGGEVILYLGEAVSPVGGERLHDHPESQVGRAGAPAVLRIENAGGHEAVGSREVLTVVPRLNSHGRGCRAVALEGLFDGVELNKAGACGDADRVGAAAKPKSHVGTAEGFVGEHGRPAEFAIETVEGRIVGDRGVAVESHHREPGRGRGIGVKVVLQLETVALLPVFDIVVRIEAQGEHSRLPGSEFGNDRKLHD